LIGQWKAVTETQQATKTTRLNLGEIGLFCAPWNRTCWKWRQDADWGIADIAANLFNAASG
jgi:hypothetical protein